MGEVRWSVLQALQGRRWARRLLDVKLGRQSKPRPSPGAQGLGGLGGLGPADGHGQSTPEERAMSRGGTVLGEAWDAAVPPRQGRSPGSATAVVGSERITQKLQEGAVESLWALSAWCDGLCRPRSHPGDRTVPDAARPLSLSASRYHMGCPGVAACVQVPCSPSGRWQPDVQKEAGRASSRWEGARTGNTWAQRSILSQVPDIRGAVDNGELLEIQVIAPLLPCWVLIHTDTCMHTCIYM